MMFELESKRLVLRALNENYAPNICDFYKRNLKYLSQWEPNLTERFTSIDAMKIFLKADCKNMLSGNSVRYWFSFKNSPDNIIGSINFQGIRRGPFKSCQIGYKIDKEFSGQGLTFEAANSAISSLFVIENIHRVEALIATDNLPSIHLAERLGFIQEGICREYVNINNQWKDCCQYSLLNGELKAL